jgi:diaminopimelate decarboxylase
LVFRGTSTVNSLGHLEIGGVDTIKLAEQFGTPLFVYDAKLIKERARLFKKTVEKINGKVYYASKAFTSIAIYQLLAAEGFNFDVVSGGEFYTAIKAGVNPQNILFHGNNKSKQELEFTIENNIGCIVIDNDYEIELIEEIANSTGKVVTVLMRVTPGVEAFTHKYIITGHEDSKFGFDLYNGHAEQALVRLINNKNINLLGIHKHIGSQIFDSSGYIAALDRTFNKLKEWKETLNYSPAVLNIGGGFGIRYTANDEPESIEAYMKIVVDKFLSLCEEHDIPTPELWIEPGRSVVAEAGTTLYTLGARKDIPDIRTFLSVDGGMSDNLRPALYQAKYEAAVANKMNEKLTETVTIAGKCCETGDLLIEKLETPQTAPNDILAVFCTGAYGYSMANNYNRLPRPAVVFVEDGVSQLVIRRETYEDLISRELQYENKVRV